MGFRVLKNDDNWGYGRCFPTGATTEMMALLMETLFTGLLVLAVLMATDAKRWSDTAANVAAINIGLTVLFAHVILVPLTGCGINPARVTGSAVIAGNFDYIWIYWLGGYLGGLLGAVMYFLLMPNA